MRILVCGDRRWKGEGRMDRVLRALHPTTIIEGEASGADRMSRRWAERNIGSSRVLKFPAHWDRYGRAAGPIRNQQMIDEGQPSLVVAFHDDFAHSKGTKDMVQRARLASIPVVLIGPVNSWMVLGRREGTVETMARNALSLSFSPEV